MKNYCTGIPDSWAESINHCCKQHDNDMGYRGTKTYTQAQIDFAGCVAESTNPILGGVGFIIVFLAGVFFWKKKNKYGRV